MLPLFKSVIKTQNRSTQAALITRYGKLTKTSQWLNDMSSYIKENTELINNMPSGQLNDEDFNLLIKIVPLQQIPDHVLIMIGSSLSAGTLKKVIAEYRTSKDRPRLMLILHKLSESEGDLLAEILIKSLKSNLDDYDPFTVQINSYFQSFRYMMDSKVKLKKSIEKSLGSHELGAKELMYLAIMGFNAPESTFKTVGSKEMSYSDAEHFLQASYITGKLTKEALLVHKKLLEEKSGSQLRELVKLGPTNTDMHQTYNSYSSDMGKRRRLLFNYADRGFSSRTTKKKTFSVPDSLNDDFAAVSEAKKSAAKKLGDMSLHKYISSAGLSLKTILENLKKSPKPVIDRLTSDSIVQKLEKVDDKTFKLFFEIIKNENTQIGIEEAESLASSINSKHLALISDWAFSKGKNKNKASFVSSLLSQVDSPEKAKPLLKSFLESDIELDQSELYETLYFSEASPAPHYKKVMGDVLKETKYKMTPAAINMALVLRLNDHKASMAIDELIPTMDKSLKKNATRFLFLQGPYYKNTLTEHIQTLKSIKEMTPDKNRLMFMDTYFLWNKEMKFDTEKAKAVSKELEEIKTLKRELFKNVEDKNEMLLAMYLDKELIVKEFPKMMESEPKNPRSILLLDHFDGPIKEKYLKVFVENFADDRRNSMVLQAYISQRKLNYKWIPENLKKAPVIEDY